MGTTAEATGILLILSSLIEVRYPVIGMMPDNDGRGWCRSHPAVGTSTDSDRDEQDRHD